jgi:hypothetical protein
VFLSLATNVKTLAIVGGIYSFVRLPMPGKGKMFQLKIYCLIDFRSLELKPNSIMSAQWLPVQSAI